MKSNLYTNKPKKLYHQKNKVRTRSNNYYCKKMGDDLEKMNHVRTAENSINNHLKIQNKYIEYVNK